MLNTVLIGMPLAVYQGFIGRCLLDSREYDVLKNSVISHVPEDLREGNMVECLCSVEDATLLLRHANRFYPVAGTHIEESIRVASQPTSEVARIEYRKLSLERLGIIGRSAPSTQVKILFPLTSFPRPINSVTSVWLSPNTAINHDRNRETANLGQHRCEIISPG